MRSCKSIGSVGIPRRNDERVMEKEMGYCGRGGVKWCEDRFLLYIVLVKACVAVRAVAMAQKKTTA